MTGRRRIPAERLLHPAVLAAIVTLAVNDHVLKVHASGWVTGKLSDLAGLFFFPLLLQGLLEFSVAERVWQHRRSVLAICCLLTAGVFSAVQLVPVCTEAYQVGLAALQWPVRCMLSLSWQPLRPVACTPDPTDLFTVPVVGLCFVVVAEPESVQLWARKARSWSFLKRTKPRVRRT